MVVVEEEGAWRRKRERKRGIEGAAVAAAGAVVALLPAPWCRWCCRRERRRRRRPLPFPLPSRPVLVLFMYIQYLSNPRLPLLLTPSTTGVNVLRIRCTLSYATPCPIATLTAAAAAGAPSPPPPPPVAAAAALLFFVVGSSWHAGAAGGAAAAAAAAGALYMGIVVWGRRWVCRNAVYLCLACLPASLLLLPPP